MNKAIDDNHAIWAGLMTGTSMDGVDVVLTRLTPHVEILAARTVPLPAAVRERILAAGPETALREIVDLDAELAAIYAGAITRVLDETGIEPAAVSAIGCHGQTVWHAPWLQHPITVQLGDPNLLAERTGITVVSDFRRRDLAAGGQGAPLAPAFHQAFFHDDRETRAVVNIGGMANLTLLPSSDRHPVIGFDTGPGNVLMDTWIQQQRQLPFDRDGTWASEGTVIAELLERMEDEPYFHQAPPKSTGRETFNADWLQAMLTANSAVDAVDVQATLAELTARSIGRALREHAPGCNRVLLCGGGALNAHLRVRIAAGLPDIPLETTDDYGVPADWVEAVGFAWLAARTSNGLSGNIPSVTGARHPVVLGALYQGAQRAGHD